MDILEVGNQGDPWKQDGRVMTMEEWRSHYSLWIVMKAPIMIGCDLSTPLCKSALPLFLNKDVLAVNQDDLGVQAKRVRSSGYLPITKSGMCRSEELPQNTIIAPCHSADPLQQWQLHPNGTISREDDRAQSECLQLDSGQGGDCRGSTCNSHAGSWQIWSNNVASAMCDDPTGCCGAKEQLWNLTNHHTIVNQLSGQCLSVHAEGLHNVGVNPCTPVLSGLQVWDFRPRRKGAAAAADTTGGTVVGQFVSSVMLPSGAESCLTRTDDVAPGKMEVFAGPLANGSYVVLLFNRNMSTPVVRVTAPTVARSPTVCLHNLYNR